MDIFLQADTWIALLTLCFLEVVLGIDNIIFISILSNKLDKERRQKVRNTGLLLAMGVRILFLFGITWIIGFTKPLFSLPQNTLFSQAVTFSSRDLILGIGGLFLIAKSTREIHSKIAYSHEEETQKDNRAVSVAAVIWQIVLIDIIFSADSILTAIGMVDHIIIMIIAVMVSILIMILFAGYISRYIQNNPSIEMIALAFLILIGFTLLLEAFHKEVSKGYIYFAIIFSLSVEAINKRLRNRRKTFPQREPIPSNTKTRKLLNKG